MKQSSMGSGADLRTTQNRMLPFVARAMAELEESGAVKAIAADNRQASQLMQEVRHLMLSLLAISPAQHSQWHIGIADSGKRAIEGLVSCLCPGEEGANVVVNTGSYCTFNTFSAAAALKKQKNVEFLQPFKLEMGEALTRDSDEELAKAREMICNGGIKTLWIAWNNTSTGVVENVDRLISMRNNSTSESLIISDAASLPLFSNRWRQVPDGCLPDVFFFSLRKQSLPYEGPQDEASQAENSGALYLFNNRALQRAKNLRGPVLHEMAMPWEAAELRLTQGPQRENHVRHLLKLRCALSSFLAEDRALLTEQDTVRTAIHTEIRQAFHNSGTLGRKGFSLVANAEAQSESIYIIEVPEYLQPKTIIRRLKDRGVMISPSMHPQLLGDKFFQLACYPATSLDEARMALSGLAESIEPPIEG